MTSQEARAKLIELIRDMANDSLISHAIEELIDAAFDEGYSQCQEESGYD